MTAGFRLLGDLEVRTGDRLVDVGHARQRTVLVVLLLSVNQVVPADTMVDRVWGVDPPRSARNTLHSYLARLRRALAGCADVELTRRSGGYVLSVPTDAVDVHRFRGLVAGARTSGDTASEELLTRALALWQGEPFADLDTPWLNDARAELRAERLAAELDHTDLLLRKGEHARVVPELVARVAAHPVHERLAGQLILALYRAGRQAEALDHYTALRRRLAETLGVDPGPQLRELHQRILTADPGLTGTRTVGAPPVPRQLPAPPASFVGRVRELAELDKAADTRQHTMVVAALGGQGGIGKSWLALRWAHQNADRFPDGQLYLDLHGFDPTTPPVDPNWALAWLLAALAVPPRSVPTGLSARAGLFRSLVSGRRMLLVLDNAGDAGQVVPLLPGSPTCTVLVTSRSRLDGLVTAHGAVAVDLDVLHETEARELLASHVGHGRTEADPAATRELLARCAGLPLAIAVVAARAARHPDFALAELAGELRDRAGRLDALDTGDLTTSLREVCASTYQALDPDTAELFALLGVSPGTDVSLAAAASLAGRDVRVLLRALENAHLVRQHQPGRYRMHDLIHLYSTEIASTRLPEERRAAALRRLVDHYLHTAYAAERLLEPHRVPVELDEPAAGCQVRVPHTEAAALAWFEAEHVNLLAAQASAAAEGWHAAVWQLPWTLSTFHSRRGLWHDLVTVWERALAGELRDGDPAIRALAHRSLGHAHVELRDTAAGRTHLAAALELAADTVTRANIHHVLARVHDLDGDPAAAMRHGRLALDLHRDAGNEIGATRAGGALAWLAAHQGRHDEARQLCADAIAAARALGSPEIEAACLDTLGYVAHETGDHEAALRHYTESLTSYDAIGEGYAIADTHDHLAHTHAALGDDARARDHWQRALALYDKQLRSSAAARTRTYLAPRPE